MADERFGLVRPDGLNLNAIHNSFPYQLDAVEAVKNHKFAALFHEQGLGKTKIAIDLSLEWLRNDVVDTVCFVTKRGLVKNWVEEIRSHAHLEPSILNQDRRANFYVLNSPARFVVLHYEVLKSDSKRIELFLQSRRVGAILDESQKIKNPSAALTQAFLNVREQFVRRIIMTGTPIANRPEDIWSQIFFLDGGAALGTDFDSFRSNLNLSNDLWEDDKKRSLFEQNLSGIFGAIDSFTVRETKNSAGIDLPSKRITNIPTALETEQRLLYDNIRLELRAEVLKDGEVVEEDAEVVLKRLLRLVQIASNPKLIDEGYEGTPAKMTELSKLLRDIAAVDSKAIIWTNFVKNADWLKSALSRSQSVAVVHGGLPIDVRNQQIDLFKNDSKYRLLVATPGAAKEGLTLTVANHAIFFDRSFSLDDYLQAQDRIHRISQMKRCFIWNLIGENTVDEWVDQLLIAKRTAASLAQADITEEQFRDHMSYDFGRLIREIIDPQSLQDNHNG
ncbi:MAG: DEAD/DEAH box helicase [Parasphingopyxis sp.]|uniref:DEAD/DEAH box helicase n=1 Tax=Parasphingopyxis sp. TaxID=1920299 RepID=UPI003F9F4701